MNNPEKEMDYTERQSVKSKAREMFHSDESLDHKAYWLHMMIYAYYWRAREAMENEGKLFKRMVYGKHYFPGCNNTLEIDFYTKNWLYSNAYKIPEEIVNAFTERYGYEPKKNKYMPMGMTIYQKPQKTQ